MPIDPLEEFAQGFAPGFTPQQGATLPVTTQGGLPFGASAPVPPRSAPPMAPFQAMPQPSQPSPLAQLGGQGPDVMQMIAERLQSLQGVNPAKAKYSEAVKYYNALEELPKLTSIANIRSQDQVMREKNLSELAALADKFHKDYAPEVQAQVRPIYQQLLKSRAQLAGQDLPDDMIAEALTSPNLAGTYASLLNDPFVTPEVRQGYLSRLGAAKTGTERETASAAITKEIEGQALNTIQQALPQVVASFGGTRDKPLDMQTFLTNPQVKEALAKSPTLQRVFNQYVAKKENADFLANIGLSSGETALKALEGPKMTETAQELLAAMYTGPNGKPLTPALASREQIAGAVKASQDQRLMESMRKGEGAAALAMSLPAPAEERDQHIDVNTLISSGQIVKPPPGITVGELRKGAYRFARPEQQKALMALQPQRTAFGDMNAVADKLITAERWQDALAQGIRLHVGARTGSDPIARAYQDSVAAATSYLARMVESGVMTDQDVARWQSAATSSFFDTKQSRAVKIALMGDIIDAAQQAVISQVAGVPGKKPTALKEQLAKLDRLTQDTWKNTRAGLQPGETLITDGKGRYGKLQKGYKLPAGWQEVK